MLRVNARDVHGHLAPNYVADTVRAAFGTLGVIETDNIIPLAR
jgi:hypothetical protein